MRQVVFSYFTTEDIKPEKNTGALNNLLETEISIDETIYGFMFHQKSVLLVWCNCFFFNLSILKNTHTYKVLQKTFPVFLYTFLNHSKCISYN